jgi:hypothetical protein
MRLQTMTLRAQLTLCFQTSLSRSFKTAVVRDENNVDHDVQIACVECPCNVSLLIAGFAFLAKAGRVSQRFASH